MQKKKRQQLNGFKSHVTKQYDSGGISEVERQIRNKDLDNIRAVFNKYIKHYQTKIDAIITPKIKSPGIIGTGIKGRGRKQRGGNVMFFNNVKQLLNKLELIIGEVLAGNTSIEMRNTGVAILDMLPRTATINRPQYNKLHNQYFKV